MKMYIIRTITGKKHVVKAFSMSEALTKFHGIPASVDRIPAYLEIVFAPYACATI